MKRYSSGVIGLAFLLLALPVFSQEIDIPLPEHPRPDFQRDDWINLNGRWDFRFDLNDQGLEDYWYQADHPFGRQIMVPFPWGSSLSGVPDSADIAWYRREIKIPPNWSGKKIFLVIGAADWKTSVWLDEQYLGVHQGGYTPFEFDLTPFVKPGKEQYLVIRVDDTEYPFKLYGKQGYGNARGIWQTPYLEARGDSYFKYIHFTPDIDLNTLAIEGELMPGAREKKQMIFTFQGPDQSIKELKFELKNNQQEFRVDIPFDKPKLWTLDDPFLYEVTARLESGINPADVVHSYFGFRKISVINVPGTKIPYVALNNKPIYLEMSLDQAYHPEGYYTFPSDDFMRDEIIRSKKLGLNGQRIHVKIGIPRKLYWADKLGVLIMADVPNSWGEPDENMRKEVEYALREMIKRDYNHPAIFSWVIFNETWGLFTEVNDARKYLPGTQKWVAEMYHLAKELDPSRLVEDNSACNYDHVATDLNSWHAYLPGYAWEERLDEITRETFPGSSWNFAEGYQQSGQPNINSECGNVWGYSGSTGDVDWSWDYHLMINAFRKHPQIGGWLYTEHHDVINEWNGYYRYDRTEKYTGLRAFNGMSLQDLHEPIQITPDIELCTDVVPGQAVEVPLWLSVFSDRIPSQTGELSYFLRWINAAGEEKIGPVTKHQVSLESWSWGNIDPVNVTMPAEDGLAVLYFTLSTPGGVEIHKNFTTFRITGPEANGWRPGGGQYRLAFSPEVYTEQNWSRKKWEVLDGLKINGTGYGYFTYEIEIPEDIKPQEIRGIVLKMEVAAKKLLGKDRDDAREMGGDYMRGKGTFDPSRNPNAYPMTDEEKFPSLIRVYVDGNMIKEMFLPDDPADHRGILSWHAQLKDGKLREAGSYGYLLEAAIPDDLVKKVLETNRIKITLEVPASYPGGLAIYGKDFGRYPFDPTLLFIRE